MGAKESGQSLLAGVLAKVPEADRAAVQAIFAKAEAEAALVTLGESALARSDYSKNMDDLKTQRTALETERKDLEDWYALNKPAIDDYLVIKPEYDRLKGGNPPNPPANPPPGLTKAEMDKAINEQLEERDRMIAGAFSLGVNLTSRHLHMFNEPLDMTQLMAHPKLGTIVNSPQGQRRFGLQDAYDDVHGARVTEKAKAAEDARIAKLVADGIAAERAKHPNLPMPMRDPTPSPLDAITADRKPSDHTLDTAVAEYNRLTEARNQAAGL